MDVHVLPVWNQGITGKGVVVTILDDGKFTCNQSCWTYKVMVQISLVVFGHFTAIKKTAMKVNLHLLVVF